MRLLAAVLVLVVAAASLLGCGSAGGFVEVGCNSRCQSCDSDGDCCGDDSCFFFFPFENGRCQSSPGQC